MEESWIFIEDDDNSCDSSLTDSDKIDSETEAELYSKIHHDSNISFDSVTNRSVELINSSFKNDSLCMDKRKNVSTCMVDQNTYNNNFNRKRKSDEMNGESNSVENLSYGEKHESIHGNDLKNINNSIPSKTNIKNKSTVRNSHLNNYNNKTVVIHDSSDSDNDILIEESPAKNNDFKINLLNDSDIIFLSSSDSDNEPEVSSKYINRESVLKNLSMPNIRTDEDSKGLWHINNKDLYRSKKYSHRYHETFEGSCSNCNRKGHTFRSCPLPKVIRCFVCGGNHIGFRCLNRICSNCHASGHDRRNCWSGAFKGNCHLCHMEGHAKANCPDLWRRYHLTTRPSSKIQKGKQAQQDTNLYCWNCGKEGHFGAVCPMPQSSRSSCTTWPCVISYDSPKFLLKQRLSVLRNVPYLNTELLNKNLSNTASMSSESSDILLKSSNELNVTNEFNTENRRNKNKINKSRTRLRLNKVQDNVKERDFQRTPKKKSPIKCAMNSDNSIEITESPKSIIQKQLRKLRRQWNKQAKGANRAKTEQEIILHQAQDPVSKMLEANYRINSEDNLPQSLNIQIQKRFKRWVKNRMRNIRRRAQNM